MGKNKRAAKAAWRAAAAASIAASTTSPAPSLVAPVIAHDAPAGIDLTKTTPAPTQQPHEANTSNARPAPRTPSLAPHTASMSSYTAPISPSSNTPPPFAITREPQQPAAATKRDSREVRSPIAQHAPPTTISASHTHTATTQDVPTQPNAPTRTNTTANEPADHTSSASARTRPTMTAPASHSPTTTAHDSRTTPDRTIRPSAAETESEKGPEPREDEVDTARDAHGGDPRPVRSPASLASRPRSATMHALSTPHGHPTTPSARECERATRLAPATASPAPRTTPHDTHDVPASSNDHAHLHAANNELDDRRAARGDDTHDTSSANERASPHTASPASPTTTATSSDKPAHAHDGATSSTPGVEPGEPRVAAALFLKDVDPALLNFARIEELVASALREGHAAGLKEGRNTGFREGLAAGQKAGMKLRTSPAKSREEIDEKLLAGIIENARRLERRESRVITNKHGLAEHKRGLEEGWKEGFEQGRVHGRVEGYDDGFLDSANAVSTPRVDVDIQTDEAPNATHINSAAQTEAVSTTSHMSFSWADEADSLPIHSTPPLPAPRDFSVLRSSSRSPFGSLQRRARRSHRSDFRSPCSAFPSVPVITHCHPAGLRAGRPSVMQVSSPPSSLPVPPRPLSWDGDPRLVELSRVLQSLGWVRESSS